VACGSEADDAASSTTTAPASPTSADGSPGPTLDDELEPTTVVLGEPFELATYWERGFNDPRPVDMYLYTDDPSEPHPYLLFGSVTNRGDEPVAGVVVQATWFDADGNVVYEAETEAALSGRTELEPGAAADWLFVVPVGDAPTLDGLQVQLTGSPA
jgi:hypothetical protein